MDSTKIQQLIFEAFSNTDQFRNCTKRYAVSQDVMAAAFEVDSGKILGDEYFFREFSTSLFCFQVTDDAFLLLHVKYDEIEKHNIIVGYNVVFSHAVRHVQLDFCATVRIEKNAFKMEVCVEEDTSLTDERNEKIHSAFLQLTVGVCLLLREKTKVTRSTKSHKLPGVGKHRLPMDVQYIGIKVPRVEAVYEARSGANDNTSGVKLGERPAWEVIGAWHTHRTRGGMAECVHSWVAEDGSDRRQRCEHCDKLRWFVRPHLRGNLELGMITKMRYVHM
jgi:hypothetical protein